MKNIQDDTGGLLHALQGHPFHLAVEVETAGEDVRARQSLEAEIGSVSTSPDGLDAGSGGLPCPGS